MSRWRRLLALVATVAGLPVVIVGLGALMVWAGLAPGLPMLLILMLFYGWMLSAYLHYRQGRQDEILHYLSTAAEAQAPLAPALWAYLRDRPAGPLREFWVALILFFVFPGYYWVWHRRHSFDQKVARVAYFLEMGDSLAGALRASPGVVTRDMTLAVRVGERTGRLATSLRSSLPQRLGPVWVEVLPRLIYPILLIFFLSTVTGFWTTFILPRLMRIFGEFGQELPGVTQRLAEFGDLASESTAIVFGVVLGSLLLAAALYLSSTLRWYFPGVARVYRRQVRSHVLKMLAILLEVGTPLPEALALLAESGVVAPTVRRRLVAAQRRVEQGEPLADSLHRAGLLPAAMVPLVQAAERARNLPWALSELGETLADRAVRGLRRASQAVFPVLIVALGVFVGFIALGMFMPLIDLITRMAQ